MFKLTHETEYVEKLGTLEFHNVNTSSEYQAWLSEGNTPEPADPPPPAPEPMDPVEKLRTFLAANPDVADLLKP